MIQLLQFLQYFGSGIDSIDSRQRLLYLKTIYNTSKILIQNEFIVKLSELLGAKPRRQSGH